MEELGEAFRAAQNRNQVFDQAVARHLGVNQTDLLAMDILQRRGRITAGELAREMNLTTGAVTALVDRLERAGYADRVHDETDRRRVLIELSQKALDAVGEIFRPMAMDWQEYMDRCTMAELELILEFVKGAEAVVTKHMERVEGELEGAPEKSDRAGRGE